MGIRKNVSGYRRDRHSLLTRRARRRVANATAQALEERKLLSGPSWANLSASGSGPGNGGAMMMLLSNGNVLVQNGSNPPPSSSVYQLSPQTNTGSYVNGSWASTGSLNESRLFFTTAMLPDGRIFGIGGEYPSFSNTVEIYNPATGVWTYQDSIPTADSKYGDDPIQVLPPDATHPDGQVLAGYYNSTTTYLFDPNAAAGSQWTTTTAGKLHGDQSDEEAWVRLKDGSILSYDVFASQGGTFQAQRYVPSSGTWVDASNLDPTNPPSVMSDPNTATSNPNIFNGEGSEMGPGFLLPDGRVIYFGANGNTAYYSPTTGLWSAGPKEPKVGTTQEVATDDPGAMLPNGDVLIALSPLGNVVKGKGYTFPTPSNIYQFNPASGSFTDVSPGGSIGGSSIGNNAYQLNMVVLPTGQVLLANEGANFEVFTEDPSTGPQNAWRPTISNLVQNAGGSFTLTGTQINGISEGANYGDDNESATNYPIVQLTDGSGNISYATTSGWSTTNIVTGSTPETTNFTLASGKHLSDYSTLVVIANGIPSLPIAASASPNVMGPANQTAIEGASQTINLGSFIDPDGSPWTVDVNWGDGSVDTVFTTPTSGSLGTANHTYAEEGSYAAKVTVTDSTSLSGSAKFQMTVSDPSIVPSGGYLLNDVEGSDSGSQTVASFTDPGGPEALGDYGATIDWGDGTSASAGTISLSSGTFLVSGHHTYAEEGSYPIKVTLTHESTSAQVVASIAAVSDPAVIPTGGFVVSGVEGADAGTQTVATFTDPGGPEPLADYSATVDFGDGTGPVAGNISVSGSLFTVQADHTYGEEGTYPIQVTIHHETAPDAMATSKANISDPSVVATGTSITAFACLPLTGVTVATFTDPGGAEPNPSDPSGTINNHYQVASINWGDGTPLDTTTGTLSYGGAQGSKTNPFTISGSHTYATEGLYTIVVAIDHELAPPTIVTSTVTVKDKIGLLVLDPSSPSALAVTGNGGVVVNNCGAVIVNSNNPDAATITGNGGVSAMDIDVTGGTVQTGHGTFSGPIDHEAPNPDPIGLPLPAAPAATFPAVNYSGKTILTLSPGTYVGGIQDSGQGSIVLLPGVYYLQGGGLQVTGKGSLTGNGVLIINAPGATSGAICFTGQGNINLTAPVPASLPAVYAAYAGITLFQDPGSSLPVSLTGNGSVTMDGALYAPGARLMITGNGGLTDSTDTTAPVAEVIVYDAFVTGNGSLVINADAPASNPPLNTPLPGAAQASFTSFTVSTNPAVPNQPLTFSVTMASTPASAGPPAGSIDFFDQTTHLDLGSVTLSGGVATVTSSLQALGGHTITANYFAASPNFAPPAVPDSLAEQINSEAIESGMLYVGGDPGTESIRIQSSKGQVSVNVSDAGSFQTPVAGLAGLVVYGGAATDKIQVDNSLTLPAYLFGGSSYTQIQGGGGPTLEIGGSGGGGLLGGSGRSILIAGTAQATLEGGSGGSILIGGYTDYDSNLPALQAALAEWSSSDTYAMRTTSPALSIFSAATVHSNGFDDPLQGAGGSTALDWFFASTLDQITGQNASDLIVTIT